MADSRVFKRCPQCRRKMTSERGTSYRCCGAKPEKPWTFLADVKPTDPSKGRQRTRGGQYRTREEAEAELHSRLAEHEQGGRPDRRKVTVAEWLDEWLGAVKSEYSPSTWDTVRMHCERYLKPRVGGLRLRDLTAWRVRWLYSELETSGRVRQSEDGGAEPKPLSASTVHRVHVTLSRALSDAVKDGLLTANPAARQHRAPESPEQSVWSVQQLKAFYAATRDDRLGAMWRLAPSTGMRRGELAGLRWTDINFESGNIALFTAFVKDSSAEGGFKRKKLKGRRGRNIALDAETLSMLRAHRRRQAQEQLAREGEWRNDEGLVFTHPDGKPLHPDSVTGAWERAVRKAGLPAIKLHEARHTHASLMLEAGVHPKIVQERLGHSSISITSDLYSHVTPGLQQQAAQQVASLVDDAEDGSEQDGKG